MERVTTEGTVATASTYAHLFSSLPSCGTPTRLMVYDLHTLQNRFYLHGHAVASLHTTIPLLKRRLETTQVDCIAFPDDGAAKRFQVRAQAPQALSPLVLPPLPPQTRRTPSPAAPRRSWCAARRAGPTTSGR
jgi:hypothetical protein